MIVDDRDGKANVFQAASADSRNGAVVQTSHGRVPHQCRAKREREREERRGTEPAGRPSTRVRSGAPSFEILQPRFLL